MSLPYDPVFDISRVLEDVDYRTRHDQLGSMKALIFRLRAGLGFEMERGSTAAYEEALRKRLADAIPGTAAGKALVRQREEIERLRQKVRDLEAEVQRRARNPAGEFTVCPGQEHIGTVLAALDGAEDGHVVLVPGHATYIRDRLAGGHFQRGWRREWLDSGPSPSPSEGEEPPSPSPAGTT